MFKVSQPGRAARASDDVKDRIVSFMKGASTEITPSEEDRLPELASVLAPGTAVYVAHTPHAAFEEVVHAALAVSRAGFLATPHIAVRRVPDSRTLRAALAELRAGGVEHILQIAGDAAQPMGEFSSTMDVLESGVLEESGIRQIGIAGHPQGHDSVASELLWSALEAKQALAERAALSMHIVTQFGLDAGAFKLWQAELVRRRIRLPVRVGIAGPTPVARLMHFAIQCGIVSSMRVLAHNFGALSRSSEWAIRPEQHLTAALRAPIPAQLVAPHFFAFGGALETARWMRDVSAGAFDIDTGGAFRMHG